MAQQSRAIGSEGLTALVIHYTSNDNIIREDELVLVDAGCEYKSVTPYFSMTQLAYAPSHSGYASDISEYPLSFGRFQPPTPSPARIHPAFPGGRFTSPQAALYTAVLNTLKHCTALCTESSGLSLYGLHAESCRVLTMELNRIGFNLDERTAGAGGAEVERVLYPHFLSHPVGIGTRHVVHPLGPTQGL